MFLTAVTEALLHMSGTPSTSLDGPAMASAGTFTSAQIDALPRALRWQLRAALAVFQVVVALRYGRPFSALPLEKRARVLGQWAYGPLWITRMAFRPIRAMTLLAYYEYAPAAPREGQPS